MKNVVVKKSKIHGKGAFANKCFKKGEVILEIDDSHVTTDPSKLTEEQHKLELDYLANGQIVIMQLPERYINHSCDPNSYAKTIKGVRKVFAMRNIKKGGEITFNYSINGYNEGSFKCNCGSKNCRGVYQGNFFKLPKKIQIKYLPYLDDWFIEMFEDKMERLKHLEQNFI